MDGPLETLEQRATLGAGGQTAWGGEVWPPGAAVQGNLSKP
jgi:hypothetical protein